MTTKKRYKTYISALLLALYAFIATPVQLWHHHTYTPSSGNANSKEETSVLKFVGKNAESNCQICSHHYSVYKDDGEVIFDTPIIAIQTKENICLTLVPSIAHFIFDSRGPPAV